MVALIFVARKCQVNKARWVARWVTYEQTCAIKAGIQYMVISKTRVLVRAGLLKLSLGTRFVGLFDHLIANVRK